jgi:nitroimidazol reductase NimA-like FMN-containing flavoprotein (pyridoxamine 5'-phosphate oxidase superfamily)
MTGGKFPSFSELPRADALALLERNHVGRLAFSFHDRVDIEPIGYVYRDGWLYARTSPGAKLNTVEHHPWVAFEVDEVQSPFDWQSVVVHGTIYFPDSGRGAHGQHEHDTVVSVLRTIDPGAFTERDLTPGRTRVFRIHADQITGRQARSE